MQSNVIGALNNFLKRKKVTNQKTLPRLFKTNSMLFSLKNKALQILKDISVYIFHSTPIDKCFVNCT